MYLFIYSPVCLAAENMMFSNGADMNKQPIPLLHASSHDSRNLGADRSDGVHGGVLCKCEEREVYSRKKKKKSLYLCVLHLNFYFNHPRHPRPQPPLPLRRDPQLCSGAVWS